ncbi:hypothetical protein [Niabella drilacis]|uniref:Lipoprotein n=1 Tax=Niabella drilacis (strain DSM 25811 / CCM 8410 / CCUG 62505 / LMG 26954 / E90) TaxID=1285928 RepID=A0A1G7A2Z7_NIADE|nr:hypothetical protein [Niabella drilacis]SDE08425.1 hypothetical protein SAMN04487894_12041 [Niabella drilacis]
MRTRYLVLLLAGALSGCRSKPVESTYLQLPRYRMEMIVDSVSKYDTRNLQRFAVPSGDDRYWNIFEVNPQLSADAAYQRMNGKEEPLLNSFKEAGDHSLPEGGSTEVDYYITTRNYVEGKEPYFQNNIGAHSNCQAYLKNDTLNIRIGDSLYGYISFGSVFYDKYGYPSGNKARGFFRTVIKKRDW